MIIKDIGSRFWNSSTFTTWASFVSRPLNLIILTPLILTHFSENEIAIWFLFAIFINLQSLADFGFNSSLIRVYAYASGGAKTIENYQDDKIKVDSIKKINWELIEQIYSTVSYMCFGLSLIFIFILSTLGTISVKNLINMSTNSNEIWIAWAVIIFATGINIYGTRFSVYIKGMNRVALFMRWQTLFSMLSIITTSLSIYFFSNFLIVVIVYQFWVIVSVIRNYILARKIHQGKLIKFNHLGFNSNIFQSILPAAWRTWLAQFMSFGLIQLSGIFYAQIGDVNSISSYLFSIKIMNIIKQFSNAPFYSKLPRFGKFFMLDKINQLKSEVRRSMLISHLTFVISFIFVGIFAESILLMIGSKTKFVDELLWFALGVSFWLERYGAMHFQFYALTNHVVAHIGNIVSGLIYIVLVYMFFDGYQLYSFPIAYAISYMSFYSWLGPFYSLSRFRINFFDFELKASLIPLLFIILYLVILL